jgi:carbon storage regulator
MLVLSRKIGERIIIGENVIVQVLAVRRGQIRLGITAPSTVSIRREELPRHTPGGPQPSEATGPEGSARTTRQDRGTPLSPNHAAFAP